MKMDIMQKSDTILHCIHPGPFDSYVYSKSFPEEYKFTPFRAMKKSQNCLVVGRTPVKKSLDILN